MQPLSGEEPGAKPEPMGAIMVASDEHNGDFETQDKAGEDIVKQRDGLWWGDGAIVNIAGNE
jgi:hypothetical protein